jgi:hypothetical protein
MIPIAKVYNVADMAHCLRYVELTSEASCSITDAKLPLVHSVTFQLIRFLHHESNNTSDRSRVPATGTGPR